MNSRESRQKLMRIEELVRSIESAADPYLRASAVELVSALMEFHGAGIERMTEITFEAGSSGLEAIDRFAADELVSSLLLLHGLHPLGFEERVRAGLAKVRPYLESHGGNVDLVGVSDNVVRLRLEGSCNGCASSAATLELAIEDAIYDAAPDLVAIEVEGVLAAAQPSGLVQIDRGRGASSSSQGSTDWTAVSGVDGLATGAARTMNVDGRPVVFCRLGAALYAYAAACPSCSGAMVGAELEDTALVCPECGERFDAVRAGRGLDRPTMHLEPFPLLAENGATKIALPVLHASA